jgi:hypothetical protein
VKSFIQYILEDIEVIDDIGHPEEHDGPRSVLGIPHKTWKNHAVANGRNVEKLGRIGDRYTVYSSIGHGNYRKSEDAHKADYPNEYPEHEQRLDRELNDTHHYVAVHNTSGKIAAITYGRVGAGTNNEVAKRGSYKPTMTHAALGHRYSDNGISLPAEIYKHISKNHAVESGIQQSRGGQEIWLRLIRDRRANVKFKTSSNARRVPANTVWVDKIWTDQENYGSPVKRAMLVLPKKKKKAARKKK